MPIKLAEMDERVSFREQLQQETGPVVLINTFTVASADADRLLAVWAEDAAFMKQQPGFISTQLHRGIAGSSTLRQRRRLGVYRGARGGLLLAGVPGPSGALPGQRRGPTPSLPESRRARDLRRLVSHRHHCDPSRRHDTLIPAVFIPPRPRLER